MISLFHIKNSFILIFFTFLVGCTSPRKCKFTPGSYFLEIPTIELIEILNINSDFTFNQNTYIRKSGKLIKHAESSGKLSSMVNIDGYHQIEFNRLLEIYETMEPLGSTRLLGKPTEVITDMYFDYNLSGSATLVADLEYGYVYEITPSHLIKEIAEIEALDQ